ncbi:TonB-dependent receptor [Draconibacterium sp. IB214405]|uniref:SusC/RagA family TonB-linked outer membrane protein n=1 Tax=Draconibacterium sp. IB214405 TaxID=3097352 RepID=UPI002A16F4B4|nr:TonB-dependent receptor [Draconibacterium sp. IB214405]MDX8338931.1 TonB-dependent receptor [Draconibacterium sp. IB214405]
MSKLIAVAALIMFQTVLSFTAWSQTITVTGNVTDQNSGEGLPGVNVIVKGTTNGTITQPDGSYELNVSPNTTLQYSFIGYKLQEVVVNNQTEINVALEMETTELDEVVAIGYGTAKKKDITGSVSSVSGETLEAIPVTSAAEAMAGQMAGVQVVATEGSPDAEITIRVRGGGSITQDNSPMYIVDGFPVSTISDIPASEIQSIDVLKDASSTAIYGARGANGVIIITTKSGKAGKVSVSYNAYTGFKNIANTLNTLEVDDFVHWQYELAALRNGMDDLSSFERYFGYYQDIDLYDGQVGNDWMDQVYGRTGRVFNHDLSIRGGSEKFAYNFSYAGVKNREIMLGSDYKRDNVNFKLDHNPTDNVKISYSMRYSQTKIGGGGAIEQTNATPTDSRVKHTMIYSPIPLNGLEEYSDEEVSSYMINPLTAVADNDQEQRRKRLNLGASLQWDIIDALTFKTEVGYDTYDRDRDRFYGQSTYYVKNNTDAAYQGLPAASMEKRSQETFRNTNTLNFDFKNIIKNENHSVKVLAGQEILYAKSSVLTDIIQGYPSFFTSSEVFRLTTQGVPLSIDNVISADNKLLSFFGRANYDYQGKYLVSATFRADGSSKFAEGNRWGYFPSAAVAWRVSEENFMQGISSTLSNLKLRVSYGTAGNNNIVSGQMVQEFSSSSTTYINDVSGYWAVSSRMANPDLIWETTVTRNIGLDFGLFNNRLNGTVETYLNTTSDLLIDFPVSGTGYSSQFRNMGETENKGFEASVNWVAVDKSNFGLNFAFNVGVNNNKIKSLGIMDDFGVSSSWASTEIGTDYWIAQGSSVGQIRGYLSDGRYEVSDFEGYDEDADEWILREGVADNTAVIGTIRPGSMKLKDINGDGEVTVDDNTIIGDVNPKATGGFNISARIYDFDLSAIFSWSYGNDVYNANKIEYTSTSRYPYRNMIDIMAEGKRWNNIDENGQLVNDPATLEAMNANTTMWSPYMARYVLSDWAVEDGSFLRLNTLTLGYTVPEALTQKAHIQNLRLYATANNVFVLTNYSGFDPEVSTRRNTPLTPGVDYSPYPKSRQFIFGLNINF